ncbi:MAG TPA: rhamnulokinase [Petrimonas sp.]|uniref:rhamnulokinase n=1 Tax=Petrimonas sp. TaxID=2023866 RepID=UPI001751E2B5|nr:rhamnulokinase [Petrimonas sp.]
MNESRLISFLAIDLGASSGRAILGTIRNSKLELKEVNRFVNPIIDVNGRLYWDLFHLYSEILKSLKYIQHQGIEIESIGIDTWGVDFVSFGKDGEPLRMPYCYRDTHTFPAPKKFFDKILSKKETYLKTGIQIMNFNSLFQLFTQQEDNNPVYPITDKFLFMPDALSYLLTNKMVTEYTIASTSQLLNPFTRSFDEELLCTLNISKENFAPIVFPGTQIGTLSESAQKQTNLGAIPVIAVAGHDTASAVIATPAENGNFAYLSSGTWSLMGIESKEPVVNEETYSLNFTNEGGADGSIRLLKNICGMWLIEQCRKEWAKEKDISYDDIVLEATQSEPFKCFINPDAPCFTSPESMIDEIQNYCRQTRQFVPQSVGEIARCIYESLAFRYKQVLENLKGLAGFPIETLHIIGGGSQNNMLNRFTANAIGITVIAGPSEATAIGNILLQAKAFGLVADKNDMREMVRNSVNLVRFEPQDTNLWNKHYNKYSDVSNKL